jgi:hypothetical protein
MEEVGIRAWFDEYLTALAIRGRGESDDLQAFLEYFDVPLLVTTDDAARTLADPDDVMAFAQQQIEGMRAASYHHTETLDSEVTALNATSALYRAKFARRRADGSEIGRLDATYLLTAGPAGLRMSAIAIRAL